MFERLSDAAREVVALSSAEARNRGANEIGTDDVLLALLSPDRPGVAAVHASLGISTEQLERIGQAREPFSPPSTSALPFTPSLKETLELSWRESLALGSGTIEPEHLLLALLHKPSDRAASILQLLSVDAASARRRMLDDLLEGDGVFAAPAPPLAPQFSARVRAIRAKAREALQQGNHDEAERLLVEKDRLMNAARRLQDAWEGTAPHAHAALTSTGEPRIVPPPPERRAAAAHNYLPRLLDKLRRLRIHS